MPSAPRRSLIAAGLLTLTLGAAACSNSSSGGGNNQTLNPSGGSSSSASGSGPSLDSQAAALVPAAIKSKGTLVVAADATYAPNEFLASDGKTVVGMDADLAKALAKTLGLKANVENITFDSIIPGLTNGRYDLGMSSFTDTKEREAQVNFVTYFSAGTSFFVKANSGPTITSLADLCGHSVAVESGTTQEADSKAQAKKCTSGTVKVDAFPTQSQANLALSNGRDQVSMADSPVAAYQVKQSNGAFKLSGQSYGTAPYGIAVPKQDGTLDKAVLAALKDLMANGTYTQILTHWGIASGAINNPVINGAIS
jgi:polar amino acid transport system substrate-binding protein